MLTTCATPQCLWSSSCKSWMARTKSFAGLSEVRANNFLEAYQLVSSLPYSKFTSYEHTAPNRMRKAFNTHARTRE